ncbi:MAG: hypothetical protein Q4B17_04555, partial [Lautropia sp.]|nr:hypothetical protein [Lautropia sp.]
MKAVCAMRGIPVACLSMLFAVGAGVGKAAWADDHVVSVKGRATGKTGKPVSAADELEGKASGHSKAQEKSARKQKIQLPPKRAVPKPGPEAVLLAAQATVGQIPVRSWKRLRDRQIVKQDQDFSCGAASLATL